MQITHLKQTKPSNCGQTCLAMIAGCSIEEVESTLGSKTTTFQDYRSFLTSKGFVLGVSVKRGDSNFSVPDVAILMLGRLKRSGGRMSSTKFVRFGHAVVIVNGVIYDPENVFTGLAMLDGSVRGWVVRAALPILGTP